MRKSRVMDRNRLFCNASDDQGMQTFRLPVMEWTYRDKHYGRDTLLKPSSQVVQ